VFWNYQNEVSPREIFKGTEKKFLFDCDICMHTFESRIDNIVHNNTWCSYCKNKTETKLFNLLSKKYPSLIHNYSLLWSKNKSTKRFMPFDFFISEFDIIIELDGDQHF
jgi:hypothetical protein